MSKIDSESFADNFYGAGSERWFDAVVNGGDTESLNMPPNHIGERKM